MGLGYLEFDLLSVMGSALCLTHFNALVKEKKKKTYFKQFCDALAPPPFLEPNLPPPTLLHCALCLCNKNLFIISLSVCGGKGECGKNVCVMCVCACVNMYMCAVLAAAFWHFPSFKLPLQQGRT